MRKVGIRGVLPHLDAFGEIQAVTFRLADALPASKVKQWKREISAGSAGLHTGEGEGKRRSEDRRSQQLRERIARHEDAGYGSCLLRKPENAKIVQDALLFFDGERYRLLEWCIMPNHVHAIIKTLNGHRLDQIVKSWKAFTSRKINQLENRTGPLWQREYHDRYIRDPDHLTNARIYVRKNPVKAGLCVSEKDWPWDSAGSAGLQTGDSEA